MPKIKRSNLTKKEINRYISLKIGLSDLYTKKITEGLILSLKKLIKNNELTIKNFGSFKVIFKSERIGRNPKNKKIYKISARKSLKFTPSKNLVQELNL